MNTSIDFLDAVKAKYELPSDYALAKLIEIKQPSMSALRSQKTFLGDDTAIRVAKLLDVEPATVLAAVHAERAKTEEEKSAWRFIYEKLGGIAASVALAAVLFPASPTAARAAEAAASSTVYIM